MKKNILTLCLLLFSASQFLLGQNFSASFKNGDKLYFCVTDTLKKTVGIARLKTLDELQPTSPKGKLEIPDSVVYKGTSYQVTSIGEKAFSGADKMTFVSIPSSVDHIGNCAFEGCVALEGVVFPSQQPQFGNDVFKDCCSISSVSIGGDWQSVDCSLFADSYHLEELYIPARVRKITNFKKLSMLNRVSVDPNNAYFSSKDGLLYTKDGATLLGCPTQKAGPIVLPDGTEKIYDGAFDACVQLTEICLPQSLYDFSYTAFEQCLNLVTLIFLAEVPPTTAKWNGFDVFSILPPNAALKIEVPSDALQLYRLTLCNKPGEYKTKSGGHQQTLMTENLASKESIHKIKKLPR